MTDPDASIAKKRRVVIDTNVLVSALKSRRGASFKLMQLLGSHHFFPISPPLCLEYEDVLQRPNLLSAYTAAELDDFLDYFLSESMECRIYFLWRPYLRDPKDDMILELALASGAETIITHDIKDFSGIASLGIHAVTPADFMTTLTTT